MDQKVTCKMCGAEFMSEEELKMHNAQVHNMKDEGEVGVKCSQCGMSFKSQDELDTHVKDAHGDM